MATDQIFVVAHKNKVQQKSRVKDFIPFGCKRRRLLLWVLPFLLLPETSWAYLDPGSGNALVYLFVSLAGAALYYVKSAYYRFLRLFGSDKRNFEDKEQMPDLALFSEGTSYWPMFKPLIDELLKRKIPFQYVSMDVTDPALRIDSPYMHSSFLGFGSVAYPRLAALKAKLLVVTTPNIGTPGYPVPRPKDVGKLIYAQHGIGDATYLKKGALDHYDVDLECGPWCEKAMRELEKMRSLKPKEFYSMGVLYLDGMIRECQEKDSQEYQVKRKNTVLVAPSWGVKSCLHVHGTNFIDDLLNAGFEVILRPHPQSFKFEEAFIRSVISRYSSKIHVDCEADAVSSMLSAGVLISDASAIRMDFALTQSRPVLTLSVPKSDLSSFEADALGRTYDEELAPKMGAVLEPGQTERVVDVVRSLIDDTSKEKEIKALFNELVVNQGHCAKAIVDYLESQLKRGK